MVENWKGYPFASDALGKIEARGKRVAFERALYGAKPLMVEICLALTDQVVSLGRKRLYAELRGQSAAKSPLSALSGAMQEAVPICGVLRGLHQRFF